MRNRFLAGLLGMAMVLVGCTTPPITTPQAEATVYLRDIVPVVPESPTPMIVPAGGPFPLPAIGVDVPANARSVTLTAATLHLDLTNHMKIPLGLKVYLSGNRDTVYEDASLLGEVDLQPEQAGRIDQPVKDPAIFKGEKVWVGIRFSTPGSGGIVTVQGSDSLVVRTSATVQVKLF
ncbi:hypothetical protein D3C87_1072260 [compost metagenome]